VFAALWLINKPRTSHNSWSEATIEESNFDFGVMAEARGVMRGVLTPLTLRAHAIAYVQRPYGSLSNQGARLAPYVHPSESPHKAGLGIGGVIRSFLTPLSVYSLITPKIQRNLHFLQRISLGNASILLKNCGFCKHP
jgi:hypothetical protein